MLPEAARKRVERLAAPVGRGKAVDLRVRREGDEVVRLLPAATAVLSELLSHLGRGEKVAILAADTEPRRVRVGVAEARPADLGGTQRGAQGRRA